MANSPMNSLLHAAECVLCTHFGLNIKVKGSSVARAPGKVDRGHFIKADVDRRFVDKDEAPFQWIEEARGCLVRAGYGVGASVTDRNTSNKHCAP